MLALDRQNITFTLCYHRVKEKALTIHGDTVKDQSKHCLHIKLLKPRIILNSTRLKHLVIGWLLRRRSLPLVDYYRPNNSDFTLEVSKWKNLVRNQSQRLTKAL